MNDVFVTSSDACGMNGSATIKSGTTSYGCSDIGSSFTIVASHSDNNGNEGTCTGTVTVEDNIVSQRGLFSISYMNIVQSFDSY